MGSSTVQHRKAGQVAPPVDGKGVLDLARADTPQSLEQLRQYSPEELAGALQELPAAKRMEFLELAERADEIVPLLPEAEFAATVVGAGVEENGWLTKFATPRQRVAAVDLDCWKDFRFSPSRLFEWIDAMIEAGPETLVASFEELDFEVWVLAMKEMGEFSVFGVGTVDPEECSTVDGVVFYNAHSAEHEERIRVILSTAQFQAPSSYWDLVYGAVNESRVQAEEFAAQRQRGRLADLGFPERGEAMRAYRPMKVDETPLVDVGPDGQVAPVVAQASFVPQQLSGRLVGRALAELPPERVNEVMAQILGVANALAVADRLPLAEPETVERSLAKALLGIDRGLAEVAQSQNQALGVVIDRTPPIDLFRIGATLDPELRPRTTLAQMIHEEDESDWNIRTEEVAEEDRTVASDGRLNWGRTRDD